MSVSTVTESANMKGETFELLQLQCSERRFKQEGSTLADPEANCHKQYFVVCVLDE
jgi:hypothetical protein